jgi:hypothetical protein
MSALIREAKWRLHRLLQTPLHTKSRCVITLRRSVSYKWKSEIYSYSKHVFFLIEGNKFNTRTDKIFENFLYNSQNSEIQNSIQT